VVSTFYRVEDSRRRWRMDRRRDGRRDRYLYIIDCLRLVVAFAPKVIKCAAYGVAQGRGGGRGAGEGLGMDVREGCG
jgi:hypothetical protein